MKEVRYYTCETCKNEHPHYKFTKKQLESEKPVCRNCNTFTLQFLRRGIPLEAMLRVCMRCEVSFQSYVGQRICRSCVVAHKKAQKYFKVYN